MKILDKLKCKLRFHDFQYSGVDNRFMPKVQVLLGKCSRCPETQNFFWFFDSRKVVVENHGVDRLFGQYAIMPLEE